MHILYLHQHFVPPDGNGGTRSLEMARRFVQAGHEVTIVTSSGYFPSHYEFTSTVVELEFDGVRVRVVRVPYSNRMGVLRRLVAFARFAFRSSIEACRVRAADVVFATSTPLTIVLPGAIARRWHRAPMVFEVRDLWPEVPLALGYLQSPIARRLAEWMERWAYAEATHVVALSPGMKAGVVRSGISDGDVTVIPNSADLDLFAGAAGGGGDSRLPEWAEEVLGRPTVMYVGTLGVVNGSEYFVGLAAAMRRRAPHVRFVLMGDGNQRERVVAEAETAGVLSENLWVVPPVPKTQVPAILQRATMASSTVRDVPALWHNSANKFFDALAAGKPVMINHEGWQADLIREEEIGVVLPPDDFEAAADILAAFVTDPEAVRAAGERALGLARERFSRDRLAQELLAVLEEATAPEASVLAAAQPVNRP